MLTRILLLCLLAANLCAAGDPLRFNLKGFSVGMSMAEASEALAKAKNVIKTGDHEIGIDEYALTDGAPPARTEVTFLDGKIVRIVGDYSPEEVAGLGGATSLAERLEERLGVPPTNKFDAKTSPDGGFIFLNRSWHLPSINRLFMFSHARQATGKVEIYVVASDLGAGVNERRKTKKNPGF